jgi:hypothetical protein
MLISYLGVAFGPGFPLQVLIALRSIAGFTVQSLTRAVDWLNSEYLSCCKNYYENITT